MIPASKSKRQMIQRVGRVIQKKTLPRPAKILISYVKGTSEDLKDGGGHEGFLSEVEPKALELSVFSSMHHLFLRIR